MRKSKRKKRSIGKYNRSSPKYIITAFLLITVISLGAFFLYAYLFNLPPNGNLSVKFIDVGQGDCALFVCKDTSILFDSGTVDSIDGLSDVLAESGIDKLDCAVFTHPHEDHIGGAVDIIEEYQPDEIIMPSAFSDSSLYDNLLFAVDEYNIKMTVASKGDYFEYGDISMNVFSPTGRIKTGGELNHCSLVIKLTYGNVSFLMCGDAENDEEEKILSSYSLPDLKCDVIKIAHHGSDSSSSDDFLKAVNPKYAVISCGYENPYGHPHLRVLYSLEKLNIKTYRTDLSGTINIVTNGKQLSVKSKG